MASVFSRSVVYIQNLSEVYDRLLHYTDDSNEVYIVGPDNLPKWALGRPYRDIAAALALDPDKENPAIVLGIQLADGKIMLNPLEGKSEWKLNAEDRLIVLAYSYPDLRKTSQPNF